MGTIGAVLIVILVSMLFIALAIWPLVEETDARAPTLPPIRVLHTGHGSEQKSKAA